MPIECASICFAIFPGGVSEPKGNFSTLSVYARPNIDGLNQAEDRIPHIPAHQNHFGIERQ
jgi:hypothetical protein